MNPHFPQLMAQLQQQLPKVVAEMAHYHKGRDDMELKPAQAEVWNNAFSFVECLIPPPKHPTRPDDGLCMEFKIHNKVLGIQSFWLADTGNLTQDPEAARLVPRGWQSETPLRTELRTKSHEGIQLLKTFLKEKAGVPKSAIYDNIP
jgi:hypothetical protein